MTGDFGELLGALLPEAALVLGALLVLGIDLAFVFRQPASLRLHVVLAIAGLATLAAILLVIRQGHPGSVFDGALALDQLARVGRVGVLGLTLLTLALVPGGRALRHPAEYVSVILFASTGFLLMAVAQQLLIAFLAIELASLSLYILAGFEPAEGSRPEAAEAALKYFLFGGMAAAFLLFGFSLVYGITGSLQLPEIARGLSDGPLSPLLAISLVMILVAFGFKAAAAPFHLWAPDAYQGAPVSSAALIASASKVAGFVVFTRILVVGLGPAEQMMAPAGGVSGWLTILAVMSAASLILGNLAALAQSNARRLLAYSAIAHAGALLLGVMSVRSTGTGPLLYYVITYGIATVGAFGVLAALEKTNGGERISDLAGLRSRSPLLTGCLLVFVLSLAGIPPLAGFFGKFSVFAAAFGAAGAYAPLAWLAGLAIALSAVALYYYLLLLKQALVVDAPAGATPIEVPATVTVALVTAAAALVVAGVFPSLLLQLF